MLASHRERAAQCRGFAHRAPDAATRNELIEGAELLESEAGPKDEHRSSPGVTIITGVMVPVATLAIVAAVAALLVLPVLSSSGE